MTVNRSSNERAKMNIMLVAALVGLASVFSWWIKGRQEYRKSELYLRNKMEMIGLAKRSLSNLRKGNLGEIGVHYNCATIFKNEFVSLEQLGTTWSEIESLFDCATKLASARCNLRRLANDDCSIDSFEYYLKQIRNDLNQADHTLEDIQVNEEMVDRLRRKCQISTGLRQLTTVLEAVNKARYEIGVLSALFTKYNLSMENYSFDPQERRVIEMLAGNK